MKLVVDASIVVKWFVAEQWTDESRRLLAQSIERYAPDLILSETANVIWKKARKKEIQDPNRYFAELAHLPDAIVLRPSQEIVTRASIIALELNHPVYDCLYLACAEAEEYPLSRRMDDCRPHRKAALPLRSKDCGAIAGLGPPNHRPSAGLGAASC